MKLFIPFAAAQAKDSLTVVQKELTNVAEKLATTPTDELLGNLLDKAIAFGIKVLAAFVIYFVGAWLIKKLKGLLSKIFEKGIQMQP